MVRELGGHVPVRPGRWRGLMPVLARVKRHMRLLNWASGGLLILMGLLVMSSQMSILSGYLVRIFGTGLAQ